MARRALCTVLVALLAAPPLALGGGDELPRGGKGTDPAPQPGPKGPKLCLVLDYLPSFMYTGEKLAYSFRVARRRGLKESVAFEVSWHFSEKKNGKRLSPGATKGDAEKDFTIVRGFLKVPKGAKYLHFKLNSGEKCLGAGSARLIDEDEKWPKGSRASWERLVDSEGAPLILTLEERTAKVDDRWKPIRWIWEKGRSSADKVIIAGPRLAPKGVRSYQDLLAGSAERLKIETLPQPAGKGQRKAAPAHGIYRLVEMVESKVVPAAGDMDLVVLVTPPQDPEMATEPRRYRQGIDWILSRLKLAGAGRVAVVPPLTRKVPAKQLSAYAAICRKASAVYAKKVGARCVSTERFADIEYWRPKGALGKVSGRYPNADGQKLLAELIREVYK
jgi:hypothetical protein